MCHSWNLVLRRDWYLDIEDDLTSHAYIWIIAADPEPLQNFYRRAKLCIVSLKKESMT